MTRFWRYYTMATTTIIAELGSFVILWNFTQCGIFTVLFWMLVFGSCAAALCWAATDPARKPWSPKNVPFITLDENAYGHHKGYFETKEGDED